MFSASPDQARERLVRKTEYSKHLHDLCIHISSFMLSLIMHSHVMDVYNLCVV